MARCVAVSLLLGAVCGVVPRTAAAQAVDPLEGQAVRSIHVTGLRNVPEDVVQRHLATKVGQPFRRATLAADERRLDELRLFTTVAVGARPQDDGVAVDVELAETLRLLPVVVLRVTDENGLSAGPGLRGINLLGRGSQTGVAVRFGGETSVGATVDSTTITPGTWTRHIGVNYSRRRNKLYDFDEHATSADTRVGRNWKHGLRTGVTAELLVIDTGASGESLSPDGTDIIPTVGGFTTLDTLDSSTNPRAGTWAEVEVNRRSGDAGSWSLILDGRRFQPLSERHGLGIFGLATLQTGEVGVSLPQYLQFDLGGANSVRGWGLGSRRGKNQFIGTLEYAYVALPVRPFSVAGLNLYAGLQLAGFADVGLTSSDGDDGTPSSAIDGYGVGLRLLVPFVDLIRLDVAWGEPGRGATAYFGVQLKAARQRQRVR